MPTDDPLDALYREHSRAAYGLAYVLTSNPTLAEDLVHDAFLATAGRRAQLRDPAAFAPYLRRAVINAAASHFRRQRVAIRYVARGPDPSGPHPGDGIGRVDSATALGAALAQLPERQRLALACRFYLDLSERETAELLACRPGTAKALVSRGLAALRSQTGLLASLQE